MTGKMWRDIGELIAKVNIHLLQLKTQSETLFFPEKCDCKAHRFDRSVRRTVATLRVTA